MHFNDNTTWDVKTITSGAKACMDGGVHKNITMFNRHAIFTSHSNNVKVVKAYWTNDKPIYFAFKLPKYV
jgi:hypothetical protein